MRTRLLCKNLLRTLRNFHRFLPVQRTIRIRSSGDSGFGNEVRSNRSLQDRDRNNSFVPELNDVNVKLNYTFRF